MSDAYGHAANLLAATTEPREWRICSNRACGRKFKPKGPDDGDIFCVECRRKMEPPSYQEALDRFHEGMARP